jgi:hypothetical protein
VTGEDRVDASWWSGRQDDYLAAATTVVVPGSPTNLIDHLEWRRRDRDHLVDLDRLDDDALAQWFARIDGWRDCADFDVLRLLTLWFGYGDELPERLLGAIRTRLLGFKYWYTDPTPPGVVDHRWYWSENHRLIFHTCEYLAGQALPDERFTTAGLTGAEHRRRAEVWLHEWFDEKVRDGFSEWHSDSYYEKDLAPLVTLAELATDEALAQRAAAFCDLLLFDLALHSHRDNTGSTHGRSYMRFKAAAPNQTVFGVLKLCFDRTDQAWPLDRDQPDELLPATEGPTLLARCRRYRPPEAVVRVARHQGEYVDREGMGVSIDPGEPLVDEPTRSDGLSYADPATVPFWWDRGALTPWQLVPLTLRTLDEHGLWEADLFAQFRGVRDVLGDDPAVLRQLSHDLHPMLNAGLLERVDTITWRNRHAMLSTAQSYRPGCAGYQHHISQATLDEHAVVFTNHPGNGPSDKPGDYRDDDRYWTGSATLPRAVQHGRVALHLYAPAFASPDLDVLAGFAYCDHTHAYVPTERFDEVHRDGRWTVLRRRGGYVGLWSWRPVSWRVHDPATVFTNGLAHEFDLVADGGPDNVWILEVGDEDRWGDVEEFRERLLAASIEVEDHGWGDDGAHRGFRVRYDSPAEGRLELDWTGPLRVDGQEMPIDGYPRFDNPFTSAAAGQGVIDVECDGARARLDLRRRSER